MEIGQLCTKLQSKNNVVACDEEETLTTADSRTTEILCIHYGNDHGYVYVRYVKNPDSDVFQIITVLLGMGVGIKKRQIDINKLVEVYTNVYCSTKFGLHAFNGW